LIALAKIVGGVLSGQGGLWGVLGFAKLLLLGGGVWLLLSRGAAEVLPLLVGFGALPVGIALTTLGVRQKAL
jgi:hypothetical protein